MATFDELLTKISTSHYFESNQLNEVLGNLIEAYNENDIDKMMESAEPIFFESENLDSFDTLFSVCESLKDKVHKKIRGAKESLFLTQATYKPTKPNLIKKKLSDIEFEKVTAWFDGMKNSKNFKEYKKNYDSIASYFNFSKEGSMIGSCKFKKGKNENDNTVQILVCQTPKKIKVPNGTTLYHISPVNNIRELKPSYMGKRDEYKTFNSRFYSSQRIYFNMGKPSNKFFADNSGMGKQTVYIPKENIMTVFIDPALSIVSSRAVYVETKYPIKVKPANDYYSLTETTDTSIEEDTGEKYFATLEEFMEYYGLEFADDEDDYVKESFASMIGKYKREKIGKTEIKNAWNSIADSLIKHKTVIKEFDDKTFEDLKKAYETISDTENYGKYKKAYEKICTAIGVNAKDTILEHIFFSTKENKMKVIFGLGRKKIIIPNGCQLIHVTPLNKLPHLMPAFRSKTHGKYLYPNKRVFFTISKEIKGNQCGLSKVKERHIYTPKENIKTAWIDQSYPSYSVGAVYVQTDGNIPVTQLK